MSNSVIFDEIAKQEWLSGAGDSIAKGIHALFPGEAGRVIKDALHGVWLGHPLHPVLTDIPIGAWSVAMVLDAIDELSGRRELRAGADAAVAIGLAGAVGAAVTGATDWSETDGRAKTIGLLHGLLNVGATALFATSFVLRKQKRQRSKAIALSMLGFAIASGSGYLGGHLVMGEQIGVDHTATPDAGQPGKFQGVIADEELAEETPTRVDAGDAAIVLVKRGGDTFALTNTCPHLGGPLSEGKLVGDAIECPWHGSQLALEDGHVVQGPTTFPARCYDVRRRKGMVEVRASKES